MQLKVLGSSSAGNGYLMRGETESLLIEAGYKYREVLKAAEFRTLDMQGVLLSHEHGDHAAYALELAKNRIPLYASHGTLEALGLLGHPMAHALKPLEQVAIGGFRVLPFGVQHDAAEPFGYLINHRETGNILFATDTYYLKYKFADLNNIMIECNYDAHILNGNTEISASRRDRTIKSHMSLEQCISTLQANDLTSTNNIVLLHLSSDNSNEAAFVERVTRATGKRVCAARAGLCMDFNKLPF